MSNTDPLPTVGGDDDDWGDKLNTNLEDIEDGEGNLLPAAVETAIEAAGSVNTDLVTEGGNAAVAFGTAADGTPQINLYIYGATTTSVTLDDTGFYSNGGSGGAQTNLGSEANPWPVLWASTTGNFPTSPDGSPFMSLNQVNQAIAAAAGGGDTVPGAATGLGATVSSGSVALSWTITTNTQGGLTGQQIWRSGTSGTELSSGTLVHTATSGATSYTDTTVVNAGGPYFYVVVEVNAQGSSAPSNEGGPYNPVASATVPVAVSTLAEASSSGSVALTWSLPANNGGAALTNNTEVYSGPSGSETLLASGLNADTVAYTDSTYSNGAITDYYVLLHNSVGYSAPSNIVAGYYPSSGGPPVPTFLGFTAANLQFSDDFPGSSLNTTNWSPTLGTASAPKRSGNMVAPYTGNTPSSSGKSSIYNPSQIAVSGSVLTFSGVPYSGTYASQGFNYLTGIITSNYTMTKGSFSEYYVEASIRWADSSAGRWSAFWLAQYPTNSVQEIDIVELGWTGGTQNEQVHQDVFLSSGQSQAVVSVAPTNITSGYNTYGMLLIPGTSVTTYFNNSPIRTVTSSAVVAPSGGYSIIFQDGWAYSGAGYHTQGTPTSGTTLCDWIQVYAK